MRARDAAEDLDDDHDGEPKVECGLQMVAGSAPRQQAAAADEEQQSGADEFGEEDGEFVDGAHFVWVSLSILAGGNLCFDNLSERVPRSCALGQRSGTRKSEYTREREKQ